MKAVIDRAKFLEAFARAAMFTVSKNAKSELGYVLFNATGESVSLRATDLECSVVLDCMDSVSVESRGAALLEPAKFAEVLRESQSESMIIETVGTMVVVSSARTEFKLPSPAPDGYPVDKSVMPEKQVEVRCDLFRELIDSVHYACDEDNNRYALGCVRMELDGDSLLAVATDGRRLAVSSRGASRVGGIESFGALYTIRAARKSNRIIPADTCPLRFAADANKTFAAWPGGRIIAQQCEGRYPKWRDIFKEASSHDLTVDMPVGVLHAAVRQAAIACSTESRGIDFRFTEGTASLKAATSERGQSHIEFPAAYDGRPVSLRLDSALLREFLRSLKPEDNVTLSLKDSKSAAFFECAATRFVLMPLAQS